MLGTRVYAVIMRPKLPFFFYAEFASRAQSSKHKKEKFKRETQTGSGKKEKPAKATKNKQLLAVESVLAEKLKLKKEGANKTQ